VLGYAQPGMTAALGLSTRGVEAVSAALFMGASVGALAAGAVADAWGQLAVLRGTAALFVVAALAMAAAPGFAAMLAGRAVAGLAVGASVMVVPVYLSERTPPSARAGVVALLDVAVCVGCVVAAVAGAVAARVDGGGGGDAWRYLLAAGAVPALAQAVALARSPVTHPAHPSTPPADRPTLAAAWRHRPTRAALLTAVGAGVAQNAAFSSALLYYAPHLLARGGWATPAAAARVAAGLAAAKLLGVCGGTLLLHSCPRRRVLVGGAVAQAAALACMAAAAVGGAPYATGAPADDALAWARRSAMLASYAGFILAWNASWAPGAFVVAAEVLPSGVRARGMGCAVAAFWVTSAAANGALLTLVDAATLPGALAGIAALAAVSAALQARWLPETAGLALEEVTAWFEAAYPQPVAVGGGGQRGAPREVGAEGIAGAVVEQGEAVGLKRGAAE
jgi:MFS family permease